MRQEVFNEQMETLQDYFEAKLTDRRMALYLRHLLEWNEIEFVEVVNAIIGHAKTRDPFPRVGQFQDVKNMLRERRTTKAPDGNGGEPDQEKIKQCVEAIGAWGEYEAHHITLGEAKRRSNQRIDNPELHYVIHDGDDGRYAPDRTCKGFCHISSGTMAVASLNHSWGGSGREGKKQPKAEAVTETPAHVWPEEPPEVVQAIPEAVEFDLV